MLWQSTYRVSCAVLLENGASTLEFLKFYGPVFLRLNVSQSRGVARRRAIRLLYMGSSGTARSFEKLIGCGLGSVLNFIAQIELKFTAKVWRL